MLLLVFHSNVVASYCILPQNLRDYSKILVKTAKSCSNLRSPDQRSLKREGETSLLLIYWNRPCCTADGLFTKIA